MNSLVNIKLTEKEEKAIATVVAFFQGLKDCDEGKKEEYLLQNSFASRMILSFGKTEPKDTHAVLSSALIQNIIPYLVARKDDSIDEIAEEFDKKTDDMMKEVLEKRNEILKPSVEKSEAESSEEKNAQD